MWSTCQCRRRQDIKGAISWPKVIKVKGGIRQPRVVDGIPQKPIEGAAKQTAKEIADQLRVAFQKQGRI